MTILKEKISSIGEPNDVNFVQEKASSTLCSAVYGS